MNNFRNEMTIEIGAVKILLRPTFENIATVESDLGSVAYLAWKFSRGTKLNADGKPDPKSLQSEETIKSLPSLTEVTKIIYYNQVNTKEGDLSQKQYSMQEIWDMLITSGHARLVIMQVTVFIGKMLAGGNFDENKKPTEAEKKS